MIVEIWIDGQPLELYSTTNITHTFVANDISEVRDRQASFTNSFAVPKTSHNMYVMGGLGIHSDGSRVPYTKPNCQLKYDGYDLIVKGWVNITETNDEYKLHVYSGIVDFFKAAENKTIGVYLADELSVVDHTKTVANVVASFSNPAYRYLIADYGGEVLTNDGKVDIEYLMPAINALWLWNAIHTKLGFTYTGAVLSDLATKWITYPKAKNITENIITYGEAEYSQTTARNVNPAGGTPVWMYEDREYHYFQASSIDAPFGSWVSYGQGAHATVPINGHYIVPETGYYKIEITGTVDIPAVFLPGQNRVVELFLVKNAQGKTPKQAITTGGIPIKSTSVPGAFGFTFNCDSVIQALDLSAGESVALALRQNAKQFTLVADVDIVISKVNQTEVSFTEELKSFTITDFIKDVLVFYGLTAFTSEHSSEIVYMTIEERLNADAIDWSEKYIERTSEQYIYNDYAQNNIFRYKYTEQDSNYNDASLFIDNKNIPDQKTVYDSRFYSPEKDFNRVLINGNAYNLFTFKMWEKEVKSGGVIEYKSKNNRFFMVNEVTENSPITLKSSLTNDEQTLSAFPLGVFTGIKMQDLISDYYYLFGSIVQDSRIHEIDLNLNLIDILSLDEKKVYFFNQEQQYYLLNKLNYSNDKQSGEFIRFTKPQPVVIPPEVPQPIYKVIDVTYDSTETFSLASARTISLADIYGANYYPSFRIVSLPDKGFLMFDGLAAYVNQEIGSAWLNVNKFKFKAEGATNDAFTGNYTTSFEIRGINADLSESAPIYIIINTVDIHVELLPNPICFRGIYTEGTIDGEGNQLFGEVTFINGRDEEETISPIYKDSVETAFAKKILNNTGVQQIICPTEP